MTRRRELRGAAFGLLGIFVSRNNDVGGYWALGKLYKHAKATNERIVHIDLLSATMTPPGREFIAMIEHFQQMLAHQLAVRRLPNEWLKSARISLTFTGEKSLDKPGDIFECLVELTDDVGRQRQARAVSAC